MIDDFRSAEDGTSLDADLCIIGAGAAGITIARELAGSPLRVCLVESGGLEFEEPAQDLNTGENVGHRYFDLVETRLRYFGGTTNHWAGSCRPLSPIDFRKRDWVAHSGWPFMLEDLEPFYRRAQPVCELGPYAYGAEVWQELEGTPPAFDPALIELCFWQRSPPTLFGEAYRDALAQADNVRVILHANATNIELQEGTTASVRHIDLKTLDGRTGRIRARAYVLACGGIENPRLLLSSDSVEPAGVGNRHDLVGRFFMEHPETDAGIIVSDDNPKLLEFWSSRMHRGAEFRPALCAGEDLQTRERVLNAYLYLLPADHPTPGAVAGRDLLEAVGSARVPPHLAEQVWTIVQDLDGFGRFAYRRFVSGERPYIPPLYEVPPPYISLRTEQEPNPASRVTLAEERDALGLRRPRLDWRFTGTDRRTARVVAEALGTEFARLGIGRVRLADWLQTTDPDWPYDMRGGYHHMGTTRMAADPKQGVVDPNSRVHQVDNLYIAGSSVFPTGGCTNPTLTIVALALRLADHLEARLA